MTAMNSNTLRLLLVGVSAVALAACGGSDSGDSSAPSASDTAAAVESAAEETTTAAEEAAAEVETAAAETADAVEEATADAGDAAEDMAEDAADTMEEAAAEVEETVEAAVSGGDDQVSAEVVAAYAALEGDAAQGRRVFTKCMSCHVVQEGQNRVGPSLYGIIGREAGSIEGFRYSDANANSGIVWTEPTMFAYLEAPQRFIPGTIMAYPGLPSPQERADVIAYIKAESEK